MNKQPSTPHQDNKLRAPQLSHDPRQIFRPELPPPGQVLNICSLFMPIECKQKRAHPARRLVRRRSLMRGFCGTIRCTRHQCESVSFFLLTSLILPCSTKKRPFLAHLETVGASKPGPSCGICPPTPRPPPPSWTKNGKAIRESESLHGLLSRQLKNTARKNKSEASASKAVARAARLRGPVSVVFSGAASATTVFAGGGRATKCGRA